MFKNLFIITFFTLPIILKAQIKTINIGPSVGFFDSSFVIQTGTTDSFHMGNHPQAAAYSNAEIYICENATLKYNYQMGTSSNPSFYLANGAKLKVYGTFLAEKVFMKANSQIECIGGNFTAAYLHRETPVTLLSAGSMFYDSTYTQINYTFTGWPSNANPCTFAMANSNVQSLDNQIFMYPNPVSQILNLNNIPRQASINIYDVLGRNVVVNKNYVNNNVQINCANMQNGNYYLVVKQNGKTIKSSLITKQ